VSIMSLYKSHMIDILQEGGEVKNPGHLSPIESATSEINPLARLSNKVASHLTKSRLVRVPTKR